MSDEKKGGYQCPDIDISKFIAIECGEVKEPTLQQRRRMMERKTFIENVVRCLGYSEQDASTVWQKIYFHKKGWDKPVEKGDSPKIC